MRRALAVIIACISVLVGGLPAVAGVRHTGLGIRLLDAPASLVRDPRARSYVIDHLPPGAHIRRHVEVLNDTGAPAHVLLYADGATVAGGEFLPGPGQTENELTRWTTIRPSSMDLAQGQRAVATVDVVVPRDATKGERYGVIYAELPGGKTASGFSIASRTGVRMYVDVGFGAAPPSNFTINTLTASRTPDGSPEVQAQVHNTGGRALDMTGQLLLRNGPGGLSAGPFPVELGTTLGIGQTEPVTAILDKALPAGPWLARIELRSDLLRRAAEGTITFPTANGTSAAPVKAKAVPLTKNRHLLIPIAIGLILGVAIGLILFLLWRRRRRDEDEENRNPGVGSSPAVPPQRSGVERLRARQ